jgi:hypothetical protein
VVVYLSDQPTNIKVLEFSPARGLDIERDIITNTIGRKSFLKQLGYSS